MENKYLIIMGILVLIICVLAGTLYLVTTEESNGYERIEITPNGTTIEVPANQAKYLGDTEGVKFWNWSNGSLVTYNSQEGENSVELTEALGFSSIKELIMSGASESIDGFTVYKLDGSKLSDSVKTTANGEFYCIHLVNATTHDNIIICCKDKDTALHMAKSVQFKVATTNSNTTNNDSDKSNNSSLVRFVWDDGTVEYFPAGTIITLPDDYDYRLNADGSLTKLKPHNPTPQSNDDKEVTTVETTTDSQSNSQTNSPSEDSSNVETTTG